MKASHPYKNLEKLPAWKIIDEALKDLIANGDIDERTARHYITGYLTKSLHEANALESSDVSANGSHHGIAKTSHRKDIKHPLRNGRPQKIIA